MIGFNGGLVGKLKTYSTIGRNFGIWTPNEVANALRTGGVIASGGTESTTPDGLYRVHTFTTATAVKTFSVIFGGQVEYLIVAGGGGGANLFGGGGGGGVLVSPTGFSIAALDYAVVIGSGGTGETGNETSNNTNGGNSSIFEQIAIGGGKGGREAAGSSGGSGGGGGAWGNAKTRRGANQRPRFLWR